jgi:hypothetical protein
MLGVSIADSLQIFGSETGMFGNARQHSWAEFVAIVKGEYEIGPTLASKCLV